MSAKREDVLKYLEEANMIEISELVKDIEEKFGVTAAVPVAAAAPGAAAADDAGAAAEKSTMDVVLTAAGQSKIGVIKVVRAIYTSGVVTSYSPTTYFTIADGSQNQGTIDYDTGKIVLNNFNPHTILDGTTNIKFNVTPLVNNQDVTPLREQILTTDTTDTAAVVITMVSETII